MLIVPRKRIWTQQPQSACRLDLSLKFARSIYSVISPEQGRYNAATGKPTNTDPFGDGVSFHNLPSANGIAGLNSGSLNFRVEGATPLAAPVAYSTITVLRMKQAVAAVGNITYLDASGWSAASLAVGDGVDARFRLLYNAGKYLPAPTNYEVGKLYVIICVSNAAGQSLWINGERVAYVNTALSNAGYFRKHVLRSPSATDGAVEIYYSAAVSSSLSDDEITLTSFNPWQIFRAPDSRIFVPTGAGAVVGADLTGNAQAQATATGNLTLKADLDAVALSVATASGNLTTFIPLTGAAVAIGAASGALTSGIKLSAAATASALASGSLVAQIKLNGAALAQAAASAGLTSAILLAGSGQGQATASGTLAADPGSMAGNAHAQASAVATLTTSIRLSGAAAAQAGVSGILTTNISLTAAALAQAIATGTLAVPILLAGAAHGVATATGNLTAPDSATTAYFRLASSVQRLTQAACTAQRLTTIKHEVQHV